MKNRISSFKNKGILKRMKKQDAVIKNSCILMAFFCLFLIVFSSNAYAKDKYNYQTAIEKILKAECEKYQAENIQQLINEVFSKDSVNGTAQTFIMAIYKYDEWNEDIALDYSKYIESINKEIENKEEMSVFQLQKTGITLNLLKAENDLTQYALDNTIGKKGIMSYIEGLSLLNSTENESNTISCEEVIDYLMAYQLEDGGFTNAGEVGDVDVTAMTIQALSPYYDENDNVKESVDRALEFLSKAQLEDGDFKSYGTPCSESVSQVIMALDLMGISLDDLRFVKNENTLSEGLMKYELKEGGFSHIKDDKFNEMASSQALEALVNLADDTEYISTASKLAIEGLENKKIPLKAVLSIFVGLAGIIYIAVIGRKDRKKLVSALIIMLAAVALIFCVNIQSKTEFKNVEVSDSEDEKITVTMSIRCDTIIGKTPVNTQKNIEEFISKDGIILKNTSYEMKAGDTAIDLLQYACRENDIQLEQEGNSKVGYAYVEGIQYLYELDYGDLSGWMYRVNGEFLSVGCGEYQLQEGDVVEWIYSCELGRDIGDEWNQ